jgi:hypothetical protein
MATFAAFGNREYAAAASASPSGMAFDPHAIRALPGDEVYFMAKTIDNSRLVRQADPASKGEFWAVAAAASVLFVLGATIIAPQVASVQAGYNIEHLKTERQALLDQQQELKEQEAALLDPARMHNMVEVHSLASPVSARIYHLDQPADRIDARIDATAAAGR